MSEDFLNDLLRKEFVLAKRTRCKVQIIWNAPGKCDLHGTENFSANTNSVDSRHKLFEWMDIYG